jgi:hypothetical protein
VVRAEHHDLDGFRPTGCYRQWINRCEQSEQLNELKYSHGSDTTLGAAVADAQQQDRELLCHVHWQIPFVTPFHNGHLDARSARLVWIAPEKIVRAMRWPSDGPWIDAAEVPRLVADVIARGAFVSVAVVARSSLF